MTKIGVWGRLAVPAVLALACASAHPAPATAAGPVVGSWADYECTGAYDSAYRYKVVEVEGETIRFEIDRDGKAGWLVRPLDHFATTLFKARDRGDGKGRRGQKLRGKFDGISDYVTGKTYSGRVDEWHNEGQWTWKYTITVGKRETVDHPLLGAVEVVTVDESRRVEGGSYSSKMKAVHTVSAPHRALSWEYSDEKGTQRCEISAVS